jgi:hypothetical protein
VYVTAVWKGSITRENRRLLPDASRLIVPNPTGISPSGLTTDRVDDNLDIEGALRRLVASSGSIDLSLLNRPSLPQHSHRSRLACAAKQQRIAQGCALDKLTGPLVVPRKLRANG